jgi:hypothetical protein
MRSLAHASHIGDMRNVYEILVGKPERKDPRERPRLGKIIILKQI